MNNSLNEILPEQKKSGSTKNVIVILLLFIILAVFFGVGILIGSLLQQQAYQTQNVNQQLQNSDENNVNEVVEEENTIPQEVVENDNDLNDSEIVIETNRVNLILEGSKFYLGKDIPFSIELPSDYSLVDNSNLSGGGGYVGFNIKSGELDINFGLPYESPSTRYDKKTEIVKDGVYGSIFRIKTSDNYMFYANTFTEYIEDVSFCISDGGNSQDCASTLLKKDPSSLESANSFVVSCIQSSPESVGLCDDVVKSLRFE